MAFAKPAAKPSEEALSVANLQVVNDFTNQDVTRAIEAASGGSQQTAQFCNDNQDRMREFFVNGDRQGLENFLMRERPPPEPATSTHILDAYDANHSQIQEFQQGTIASLKAKERSDAGNIKGASEQLKIAAEHNKKAGLDDAAARRRAYETALKAGANKENLAAAAAMAFGAATALSLTASMDRQYGSTMTAQLALERAQFQAALIRSLDEYASSMTDKERKAEIEKRIAQIKELADKASTLAPGTPDFMKAVQEMNKLLKAKVGVPLINALYWHSRIQGDMGEQRLAKNPEFAKRAPRIS